MSKTTEFKVGDIVRFKSTGNQFTIEDVNPNPNWREDDETWIIGSDDWGFNNVEAYDPNDLELVMDAAAASERQVPSAKDIVAGLDLLGDGFDSPVDVDEVEPDGNSALCYGRTRDGLRVSFRVTVSHVYETDF